MLSDVPWDLVPAGIVFGRPLSDLPRRALALELTESEDGADTWVSNDGEVRVVTVDGLVGLVSRADSVVLAGQQLIGIGRSVARTRLGRPASVDEVADSWLFRDGRWELEVGFFADAVAWVRLSRDDVLDGSPG